MTSLVLVKALLGLCVCAAIPLLIWGIFRKPRYSKVPGNRAMALWWSASVYLGLVCVLHLPEVLADHSLPSLVAFSLWPLLFLWCSTRLVHGWRARHKARSAQAGDPQAALNS